MAISWQSSADRDGSEALWLLPVKEGRQDGIPIFVRYGSFAQGRVTAGGALTYFSSPPKGVYEEWIASVDADGRAGSWKSLVLSGNRLSNPHLRWSPDGKEFVYATSNRAAGQTGSFARIHNVATGEERQIFQSPGPLYCVWARKEPKLFCGEVSPDKTNLVSVSTETGLTQQLGSAAGGLQLDVITPDDHRDLCPPHRAREPASPGYRDKASRYGGSDTRPYSDDVAGRALDQSVGELKDRDSAFGGRRMDAHPCAHGTTNACVHGGWKFAPLSRRRR